MPEHVLDLRYEGTTLREYTVMARDLSPEYRRKAIHALGRTGAYREHFEEWMLEILTTDPDAEVRLAAADALRDLASPEHLDALDEAIREVSPMPRRHGPHGYDDLTRLIEIRLDASSDDYLLDYAARHFDEPPAGASENHFRRALDRMLIKRYEQDAFAALLREQLREADAERLSAFVSVLIGPHNMRGPATGRDAAIARDVQRVIEARLGEHGLEFEEGASEGGARGSIWDADVTVLDPAAHERNKLRAVHDRLTAFLDPPSLLEPRRTAPSLPRVRR